MFVTYFRPTIENIYVNIHTFCDVCNDIHTHTHILREIIATGTDRPKVCKNVFVYVLVCQTACVATMCNFFYMLGHR